MKCPEGCEKWKGERRRRWCNVAWTQKSLWEFPNIPFKNTSYIKCPGTRNQRQLPASREGVTEKTTSGWRPPPSSSPPSRLSQNSLCCNLICPCCKKRWLWSQSWHSPSLKSTGLTHTALPRVILASLEGKWLCLPSPATRQ